MIRVGLIGYGLAGKVFHAPLIFDEPGLELVAIATSRRDEALGDFPGVRVCSADDALVADDLDLIVVATPNETHAPLARAALERDKAVVIDKPFALSLDEARSLFDLAERKTAFLSVFHNRRWDDDFQTLRRTIDQGLLGDIVTLESCFDRFRPVVADRWRERDGAGSGLWWDLGPHLIDQAVEMLGLPEAITADLARQRPGAAVDDYFHVTLHYGSRRAILKGGSLVAAPVCRFRAHGSAGSFASVGLDPQEARLKARVYRQPAPLEPGRTAQLHLNGPDGVQASQTPLIPGDYAAYYRSVAASLDHGAPPPVNRTAALAVVSILETSIASAAARATLAFRPTF
jgi:predicted dehydrogenase